MKRFSKNTRLLFSLLALVVIMVGIAYASVPLYTLFCKATGFGGTPKTAEVVSAAPNVTSDRVITVTFDGNVDSALPWDFVPDVRSVQVHLGEQVTIKYRAHNRGKKAVTGTATYNVQPDKAGAYFNKIQCFCFTKQQIKPGQTIELPVQFFVDPALNDDPANDDVKNITLSYTFFLAKDQDSNSPSSPASNETPEPNNSYE